MADQSFQNGQTLEQFFEPLYAFQEPLRRYKTNHQLQERAAFFHPSSPQMSLMLYHTLLPYHTLFPYQIYMSLIFVTTCLQSWLSSLTAFQSAGHAHTDIQR